ncbi:6-phospho-3-hexuloisomerase [Mycolicibacterium brisbanense]
MTSAELVSTILGEIRGVLGSFDYAQLDTVADEINSASHVVVAGEGRSGFMAKAFAMRLMHLGVPVHVVGETTTPALGGEDLLVAVSGSGTTASTVRAAEQANAVGGRVIAVTTDPDSPLAATAATVVHIPAATKYRKPGEAATIQPLSSLFDQVCHIVFDAVCLRLATLREVDNAAARAAHANTE